MPTDMDALLEELTRLRDAVEDAREAGEESSEEAPKVGAAPAENSTIKAIRAEAKRAEKRAAQAEAEAAELRKFRDETLASARQAALSAAGLSPKQSEVFLKANDEVTPELIASFKAEVLGVSDGTEEEGVPSAPFAPAGFASERTPAIVEGGAAIRDFVAKHGVEAAEKAWQEGKLKL